MTHGLPELELHRRLVRDCQESLATALARLEAYRCRERVLTRENQALRAALLHAGIRVDQVIKPLQEAAEDVGGPHLRAAAAAASAANMPAQELAPPDALYITPMTGTHPVFYNVSGEKVLMSRSNLLCYEHPQNVGISILRMRHGRAGTGKPDSH